MDTENEFPPVCCMIGRKKTSVSDHTDFQNWCPPKTNWYPLKINQLIKSVYTDFISVRTEFSHWFSKTGISVHTYFQKLVSTEN